MHRGILVPVDFSAASLRALAHAMSLAEHYDASITLLHVVDDTTELPLNAQILPIAETAKTFAAHAMGTAQTRLWRIENELGMAGIESHSMVVEGDVHETILMAVETSEINQIVMGTHGRKGISHLIRGSIAERIVRYAPCPVTVIHENESDEVMEELRDMYAELCC